jgi:hypothetical protein
VSVSQNSPVDARFILAIIMQEVSYDLIDPLFHFKNQVRLIIVCSRLEMHTLDARATA